MHNNIYVQYNHFFCIKQLQQSMCALINSIWGSPTSGRFSFSVFIKFVIDESHKALTRVGHIWSWICNCHSYWLSSLSKWQCSKSCPSHFSPKYTCMPYFWLILTLPPNGNMLHRVSPYRTFSRRTPQRKWEADHRLDSEVG